MLIDFHGLLIDPTAIVAVTKHNHEFTVDGRDHKRLYLELFCNTNTPLSICSNTEEERDAIRKEIMDLCNHAPRADQTIQLRSAEQAIAAHRDPRSAKPPHTNCPFPRCSGRPIFKQDLNAWVCSSGDPHFLWST